MCHVRVGMHVCGCYVGLDYDIMTLIPILD